MLSTGFSAVGLAALLSAPAAAFFRMPCPGRILTERADPIVFPGEVSAHVHQIAGGNGFGFTMDYQQARASTCTSCPLTPDLSNYWTPMLYYQAQNGSVTMVPMAGDGDGKQGGPTIYYLQRPGPNNDALKAFPEGFRMIAGDPFKRNSTTDFASQAVSFVCLDYSGTSSQSAGIPDKKCPDGLRAQVFFPSCWNGVDLDTPDHESHMAYPESGAYDSGPCPASHPVHLVSIFYEVIFQTDNFDNDWYGDTHPFVFAMGDATGYGFHGDFVNGWDVPTLQSAIDECLNDSGLLSDCHVFDGHYTNNSAECIVPPSVDEDVVGPLDKLPGCNPITKGPAEAVPDTDCPVTPIGTPETYFTDVTQTLKWAYVGCATDDISDRTLSAASESLDSMTVETCIKYCSGKGYTYAGMEYASQCYCGDSVAADKAPVAGILGNCLSKCSGDSGEYCGGSAALSLYKACGSGDCTNALYVAVGNDTSGATSSYSSAVSSAGSSATSSLASYGSSSVASGSVASATSSATDSVASTGSSATGSVASAASSATDSAASAASPAGSTASSVAGSYGSSAVTSAASAASSPTGYATSATATDAGKAHVVSTNVVTAAASTKTHHHTAGGSGVHVVTVTDEVFVTETVTVTASYSPGVARRAAHMAKHQHHHNKRDVLY